jgi:DNA repair exonuclease SbcCD ATPase subunit
MVTINEFIESAKPRVAEIAEEVASELQEDEPELESLQVEEEEGDSFKQAINKMEEAVQEKHQELNSAVGHIKKANDMLENPKGYGKVSAQSNKGGSGSGFSETKFVNKFEEEMDEAKQLFQQAKKAQGNIEGLREQAEHTLRQQLENMEEFGEAEDKAKDITVEAEAHLKQIEELEEQLEEARQELR